MEDNMGTSWPNELVEILKWSWDYPLNDYGVFLAIKAFCEENNLNVFEFGRYCENDTTL